MARSDPSTPSKTASPRLVGVLRRLRRRLASEHGQSMVITVAAMTAVLGMGGVSVDIASWYQTRHQAQVSADAAALAAANCLANAGSGNTCTSTTDTTDANAVATTIANDNHVPISSISYNQGYVTVTTGTSAPLTFAGMFKVASPPVRQHAVAAWAHSTTNCTNPGASCFALFGMDSTCKDIGVDLSGGNYTVDGQIFSNSSDSFQGGTYILEGAVTYGAGSTCTATSGSSIHYNGGLNHTGNDANWPIDYRTTFSSCSGLTCTGLGGTPSYCGLNAAPNVALTGLSLPGVYCAYGTGTPSNPTTWNGTITLGSPGAGTISSPLALTLIGGTITVSGANNFLKSYSGNLMMYATTGGVTLKGGNDAWSGDIFAPSGTATLEGGDENDTTLVEANQVVVQGGNFTGDGPTVVSGGSSVLGTDSLDG